MRNLLAYWDAVFLIVMMILLFCVLGVGAGALTYLLVSSFTPAVLAIGAGSLVFLYLLFVFFKMLSD